MTRVATVRGLPMTVLDEGEYLSDETIRTGDYFEAAVLDDLVRLLVPGIVVDVGAFVGSHALYLARYGPGTTVHAFEPNPRVLPVLRENAGRTARLIVHPLAVWSERTRLLLRYDDATPGHAGVGVEGSRRFRTDAVRLDDYGFPFVAAIKVDVEGSEPEVLAGARRLIERDRPVLVIEDWERRYADLLPGYRLVADHGERHQTYIYAT